MRQQSPPAILIGGPPHAGKSVLSYYVSRALRARAVPHYLLRIAPDGEGDWYQEGNRAIVGDLRQKGVWTEDWIDTHRHNIAARQLMLLVDTGGKPTEAQKKLFDVCSHVILLTKTTADHRAWLDDVHNHGLKILADLTSIQSGVTHIDEAGEVLEGQVCDLERGRLLADWAGRGNFDVLVERLAQLVPTGGDIALNSLVLGNPVDATMVNLQKLAIELYPNDPEARFVEQDADLILSRIPHDVPLALYGRMPTWLVCKIGAERDARWQFNAASGWVRVPVLAIASPGVDVNQTNSQLEVFAKPSSQDETTLHIPPRQSAQWLDPIVIGSDNLPFVDPARSIVIDGKIPFWLILAIARAYKEHSGISAPQAQGRR